MPPAASRTAAPLLAPHRHFPPPPIDDGLGAPAPGVDNQREYETYTSSASSASNQAPKQGKIFICNIDVPGAFGARRNCGCKIKIIDGEEARQADRAAHAIGPSLLAASPVYNHNQPHQPPVLSLSLPLPVPYTPF